MNTMNSASVIDQIIHYSDSSLVLKVRRVFWENSWETNQLSNCCLEISTWQQSKQKHYVMKYKAVNSNSGIKKAPLWCSLWVFKRKGKKTQSKLLFSGGVERYLPWDLESHEWKAQQYLFHDSSEGRWCGGKARTKWGMRVIRTALHSREDKERREGGWWY